MNAPLRLTRPFLRALLAAALLAMSACASSTNTADASTTDTNTGTDTAPSTLPDGAACLAVGQPATGGCESCCTGRCGGTGIVAVCQP